MAACCRRRLQCAVTVLLLPAVVTLLIWLGVCLSFPLDSVPAAQRCWLTWGPCSVLPAVARGNLVLQQLPACLCHGCVKAMQGMSCLCVQVSLSKCRCSSTPDHHLFRICSAAVTNVNAVCMYHT
jgi:hypothetical protein